MDGLGQDGMAGATAILYKGSTVVKALRYQLGSLEWHTTYKAELTYILLGMWMVGQEPDTSTASIKVDSQAAVLSLHSHRAGPGSYLLDKICKLIVSLKDQSLSDLRLRVSWVSGHDGVARNESQSGSQGCGCRQLKHGPGAATPTVLGPPAMQHHGSQAAF